MGQYDEALRVLTPLSASYPEDALTWFDIGVCQSRLGRFHEAVGPFQRALALMPDDPGAHLNLMLCYRRMMRLTEARQEEAIFRNLRSGAPPPAVIDRYFALHPGQVAEQSVRHEHALTLKKP